MSEHDIKFILGIGAGITIGIPVGMLICELINHLRARALKKIDALLEPEPPK